MNKNKRKRKTFRPAALDIRIYGTILHTLIYKDLKISHKDYD